MSRDCAGDMRAKKLKKAVPVDRQDLILSLCSGKNVLDLGCADYPMTEEKLRDGELLYAKICEVADKVTGVDYSPQGIEVLRSAGYENLLLGSAEELDELHLAETFDVILAGELIEHLMNVGRFFEGAARLMSPETSLIVTVPNAHAIKRFLRVLFGSEMVNRDHAYYFSQANIELLCDRYGLRIDDCYYYLADVDGSLKRVLFAPLRLFVRHVSPYVSDHLVFVCSLAP
jgi:2-polyprenyl-3-methyl-5-hydroxy-6-metoxy-1,4-benzoquinol methylase